jgi:hypothetical protein
MGERETRKNDMFMKSPPRRACHGRSEGRIVVIVEGIRTLLPFRFIKFGLSSQYTKKRPCRLIILQGP